MTITENTTVKTLAVTIDFKTSSIATATFQNVLATISPKGEDFVYNQEITLTCYPSNAPIHYLIIIMITAFVPCVATLRSPYSKPDNAGFFLFDFLFL